MVHEAMVLEYSGRHLAMIEAAAALKLLLYVSLLACVFVPWGIAGAWRGHRGLRGRRRRLWGEACLGRRPARPVRDLDRQDARLSRARVPWRRADAGPARHPPAVRLAEPVMEPLSLRRRAPAGRQPGPDQLHAAVPGPHVRRCSTCSPCTPSRWCSRSPGRRIIQDAPHLYVTAAIALVFKAIFIPVTLHRIVLRLGIHRTIETVVGIGLTMLAGIGLVALSIVVMLPAIARRRSARARGPGASRFRSCCWACS